MIFLGRRQRLATAAGVRLAHRVALMLLLLGASVTTHASDAVAAVSPRPLDVALEVVDGGWGGGTPSEIKPVLEAVIAAFPAAGTRADRPVEPLALRVRHRFGGPRIDYQRDRDGRTVIFLSARDDRWYQYVYQFAHEYCHLLSHFDRKRQGDDIVRDHQWFEEAVCETASLFAVRRLAAEGNSADASMVARHIAPQLTQYAEQLIAQPHRQLESGIALKAWYAQHMETLRSQPYLREYNELVALQLLPLFETEPARWAALAWLNPTELAPGLPFADYLDAWRIATPVFVQPLVANIQTSFGLVPPLAPSSIASGGK
ncbi:MAG: hypothetical protein RIQ60_4010 [Pseudomonadota bacterium]|jgi:hypothetical protein